ncbi:MAG: hypothetical protein ACXVNO_01475 [Bacteroidia bacterium]
MEGGIFLTIKDLMRLIGSDSYTSVAKEHMAIRDALEKKTKKITIKEYCEYEKIDFAYVWDFLRGKKKGDK